MAQKDEYGPKYELNAKNGASGKMALEIRQLPSGATPRLKKPERLAGLKGRVLGIVETRVFKRLKPEGVKLSGLKAGESKSYPLKEDTALYLALLFRVLAPMRNIDRIREIARGVDEMSREEAGYWLGMSLHRSNPRRVLAALRLLLTTS